ncbi:MULTISPECIES: acyl-CoA dehydrogenase [unclassified Nocardioides]|uniref:acyl-CoA dehydrogenase n=1 Tax=unclassified Nocardioides TaxID=2615069 RepID=UPI0030142686
MPETAVRPVLLTSPPTADDALPGEAARSARGLDPADVGAVLRWAAGLGPRVPLPASGGTVRRWELLASVGAQDLSVARMLEPHLDALAILAEDGTTPPADSTWGVWAAEGPGARLTAHGGDDAGWVLDGRKPWCSLAGSLTHGLVTAWVGDHQRRLFAVEMADPGVTVEDGQWVPAGLADVVTTPVAMTAVAARPVGTTGWYLERDGFWWGGIGVAAVWYGGAVGLARRLARQVREREPDQLALMHLGEVDAALAAARATLAEAAEVVDAGEVTGPGAVLLGARVRHVVATAVELVGRHVAHAVGPGPLSQEPEHVARVADLALYVRQHHAERDAAGLGGMLAEQHPEEDPW